MFDSVTCSNLDYLIGEHSSLNKTSNQWLGKNLLLLFIALFHMKLKKLAITLVILCIGDTFQNVIFFSPSHTVVACTTCKNTI